MNAAPSWFKVVAILALIWNLMGLGAFAMFLGMGEADLAAMPADQAALYADIPLWAVAANGLAVIAGALGCLLMVLKKRLAVSVLLASLLGVLIHMGHMFFMTETMAVMGAGAMIMPLMVVLISIGLVMMSRKGAANGWLN